MRKKEQDIYVTNYLASNGGEMQRDKLMTQLLQAGIIKGQDDFTSMLQRLEKGGYVELKEDMVLCSKIKVSTPSLEDIYINDSSKVKGDVTLTPNAMPGNPTILP